MKFFLWIVLTYFFCFPSSGTSHPKNLTIRPGEVIKLTFPRMAVKKAKLVCNGKNFLYYDNGETISSYISETYFSKLTPYSCTFGTDKNKKTMAHIKVLPKTFPEVALKVLHKKVVLSKKDQLRAAREWHSVQKIYARSPSYPLFASPFKMPLTSIITGVYGTRRTFNNIKRSQHLGTDFRAPIGTPIHATNAGKIVVARDRFYSGKTVIIDHGLGIFTVYGHLSKIYAGENEYVPQGMLLGLSGKTGRTTGPHLHWGVRVNGNYVDGQYLIDITEHP